MRCRADGAANVSRPAVIAVVKKKDVVDWPSSDPSHVEFGCGKRLVRFPRTVPPFPLPKMALSEDTKVSSMGGLTVQERIVRLCLLYTSDAADE